MKTPGLTLVGGEVLLGVPGKMHRISREDLARLRYQSGDILLMLEHMGTADAEKRPRTVAEIATVGTDKESLLVANGEKE